MHDIKSSGLGFMRLGVSSYVGRVSAASWLLPSSESPSRPIPVEHSSHSWDGFPQASAIHPQSQKRRNIVACDQRRLEIEIKFYMYDPGASAIRSGRGTGPAWDSQVHRVQRAPFDHVLVESTYTEQAACRSTYMQTCLEIVHAQEQPHIRLYKLIN